MPQYLVAKKVGVIAIKSFAILVALGTAHLAKAQEATTPYPNMAPINQYLMTDQGAEIALARSAAPESISRDAEVLALGRHGFETAVKGKNGFVCIVERSWTSAPDPDFWNPKVRTPICFNAAAARSYLPRTIKRTDLILAGRTKAQTDETIAAAIDKKELPGIESGAMCYMMSKQGYGGDSTEHWPPHLMFYYSQIDPATWGAGLPGSPILASNDTLEHLTTFVVAVQRWSDGTGYLPALQVLLEVLRRRLMYIHEVLGVVVVMTAKKDADSFQSTSAALVARFLPGHPARIPSDTSTSQPSES